jgi:hypothetical protein
MGLEGHARGAFLPCAPADRWPGADIRTDQKQKCRHYVCFAENSGLPARGRPRQLKTRYAAGTTPEYRAPRKEHLVAAFGVLESEGNPLMAHLLPVLAVHLNRFFIPINLPRDFLGR